MASFSQSSFRIDFPRKDVNALYKQIKRATREIGLSVPQALRLSMRSVLNSLSTSTRVSDEYREYREVGISRSKQNRVYAVTTRYRTPKRKGKSTRASWRGPLREQLIYAYNENDLKTRPAVIIAMRGLAKESWKQAGKKGNIKLNKVESSSARNAHNARIMKRAAHRWVEYTDSRKLDNPFVRVSNKLSYIENALQGGVNSVDTAMERAGRGLEKAIDKIAKRKLRRLQRG